MASSKLLELFTQLSPKRPDLNPTLDASFGFQDFARILRENKEMRAENKALRAKLRDISALIALWPR